ncbi:unnamed protein product [Trichogramma brassicae]|uniref:DUF4455 domain-containing protein n=1 Tax=Trichogramma brassicae TaxID=86971 RepID=A0A6H5J369_9HYME|nr:unnamed protein product [Trichogramma brassicae]
MLNKLTKFVQARSPAPAAPSEPAAKDQDQIAPESAKEPTTTTDNNESSAGESTTAELVQDRAVADCGSVDYNEHIARELPLIEPQMGSLRDWSAELLKNLAEYLSLYESDIMKIVDAWLDKLTDEMTRYYQQRLEELDRQREFVEIRVYEVRREELSSHRSLLDIHKQRVLQWLGEAVNYFPDFSRLLQDYSDRCNRAIAEKGPRLKKSLPVMRLLDTVEKFKLECSNKIDHEIENVNHTLSSSVKIVEESNEIFMSQVVSFDDGGNYGSEEIATAKKEIDALEKVLHKDDTGNRQKVAKIAQQASDQLNDIHKKFFDVFVSQL